MTDQASSDMLSRLRAVDWAGDWDYAFGHAVSRRVLIREYLRRAALWAQTFSVESKWPFFDVTEYVDPEFTLPPGMATSLEEYLQNVPEGPVRRTCAGAVRLAGLRAQHPTMLPDLPDLYEPLVLFYERGGEFFRDNAGFLDLTGVLFKPGTLQHHRRTPPLDTLCATALDAVDAEGRVSYYTAADGRGPLLRHRDLRGDQCDELFSRDLRWQPANPIPGSEEEAKDAGLIKLDELVAARIIGAMAETAR
ncbi:hypothetical protein ACPCAC_25185 [Streptomyces lavendulocolor]|uniref:hypothetical protein n=1 Tax=Streptomyces lavendulocolor TaxID=67316 RepID=UPI003C2EC419